MFWTFSKIAQNDRGWSQGCLGIILGDSGKSPNHFFAKKNVGTQEMSSIFKKLEAFREAHLDFLAFFYEKKGEPPHELDAVEQKISPPSVLGFKNSFF